MPPSAFRLLAARVVKHGRQVFEGFIQGKAVGGKVLPRANGPPRTLQSTVVKQGIRPGSSWLGSRLGLRPYLGPLAAEIRQRACQNFMGGTASIISRGALGSRWYSTSGRLSLYAFLGVGLAGLGTDSDLERGYDNVCANIREIFSQKQNDFCQKKTLNTGCHAEDLDFGPLIAQSCNSAVYSARLTNNDDDSDISIITDDENDLRSFDQLDSEGEDDGDDDDDDDDFSLTDSDITIISETSDTAANSSTQEHKSLTGYPLAVKMLFNYYAASNASEIFQEMASELVPIATPEGDTTGMLTWQNGNHVRKKRLPPHPNIITVHDAFVSDVPDLPDSLQLYPMALPRRLNPDGIGRNKTLFLVMDRYRWTLRQYLKSHVLSLHESLLLLTQLTEAVVHMSNHQVAHRDLKSDNIVLEETEAGCHLVVTDFGTCLADERCGLRIPYHTDGLSKGGNAKLMAPEIANAVPGFDAYLDYRKADLWAVGAVAYEIFGQANPFYHLDNRKYEDCDLPDLLGIPWILNSLIKSMLAKDPEQRPEPSTVATCLHVMLWSPSHWLSQISHGHAPPNNISIMRWLTMFSAATLCQLPEHEMETDIQLQCALLSRVCFGDFKKAFELLSNYCLNMT